MKYLLPALVFAVCFSALSVVAEVDFNRDIRPILFQNCISCHGPDEENRKAELRLDLRTEALAERENGHRAIVEGDPSHSLLVQRITTTDPDDIMPPPESGLELSTKQIELLRTWITEGAPYAEHWAFVKPKPSPIPDDHGGNSPIEAFIRTPLRETGLTPSPEADPYTLLRRVHLDLTGLPPSVEDAERFAVDPNPNRLQKVVDRLLASPSYGEKWAGMWLDLARFADSSGYGSDPLRVIWRYRDWVIDAYNRNLPFDRFTIEQLAGDLLPDPTVDQLLATAFHRNTLTNTLGGTIDEEFRVAAVKDRVNTTAQVWMGLTAGCAQCHSHKFDPLTQQEYYQWFAIFNQSEDSDLPSEAPRIATPSREEQWKRAHLEKQLDAAKAALADNGEAFIRRMRKWEEQQRNHPAKWREISPIKTDSSASSFSDTSIPLGISPPTGIRLDFGTQKSKNTLIHEIELYLVSSGESSLKGKRVRVTAPGKERFLHIAELQVFDGRKNIALDGKARQSSTAFGGKAGKGIDGNTSGVYREGSVTHTARENSPWWEVEWNTEMTMDQLVLWNRTESVGSRLDGYKLSVFNGAGDEIWNRHFKKAPKPSQQVIFDAKRSVPSTFASATLGEHADHAIDGTIFKDNGWTFNPGKPTSLALQLKTPQTKPGDTLILRLHNKRAPSFKVFLTNSKNPSVIPTPISKVLEKPLTRRDAEEETLLRRHFARIDPVLADARARMAVLEKKIADLKPVTTPVMRELEPDKHRKTHLLLKGNYLTKGEEVHAALPSAFHSPKENKNIDRLTMARWLVSDENPLTARVTVNRYWSRLFGTGLVKSEEDFGTQGTYPTHPELLDWMALEFMRMGWDRKRFLRQLVCSSTYTQASTVTALHLEKDPENQYYARFPRVRLPAELVRDQALGVSGQLAYKMFGPSVYPPQPPGLWRAAFNGQRNWATSTGEDRFRRGLYTFLRRSVPYPAMAAFDAPNREICTVRRIPTNTPLQAFVTLNDPAYVELAQAMARRLHREADTDRDRVILGLRLCQLRPPNTNQIAPLLALLQSERNHYRQHPADALTMATEPFGPLPDGMIPTELAAWTVVCNVLLNMDSMMMKN